MEKQSDSKLENHSNSNECDTNPELEFYSVGCIKQEPCYEDQTEAESIDCAEENVDTEQTSFTANFEEENCNGISNWQESRRNSCDYNESCSNPILEPCIILKTEHECDSSIDKHVLSTSIIPPNETSKEPAASSLSTLETHSSDDFVVVPVESIIQNGGLSTKDREVFETGFNQQEILPNSYHPISPTISIDSTCVAMPVECIIQDGGSSSEVVIANKNFENNSSRVVSRSGGALSNVKNCSTIMLESEAGEKIFNCCFCDYSFSQLSDLKDHLKSHNEDMMSCRLCGYTFRQGPSYSVDVDRHLMSHQNSQLFPCTLCSESFTKSAMLKNHMKVHLGKKVFACSVCGYNCTRYSDYVKHSRVHTGEKPFNCTVCDYNCGDTTKLKRHMRIHTGEKMYKCKLCDYESVQSGGLTSHMRRHTGEKPFGCTLCNYMGITSSHLKTHMRTHTNERPYSCVECDYKCKTSTHLKKHVFRTHK